MALGREIGYHSTGLGGFGYLYIAHASVRFSRVYYGINTKVKKIYRKCEPKSR
jgi:hypothetical protein